MSYRTVFETMTAGGMSQATGSATVDADGTAPQLSDLSMDELLGHTRLDPPWRAIHADGTAFLGADHPLVVARQTGRPVHDVVIGIFNPRQDDYTWLLVNAVPQFHPGETTPYQVCATFDNVTAHKQRDDALASLAAIVDASEDAIVGKTVDGTIVSWNATATRLYGYTAAESIGQPISLLVPPAHRAELTQILERIRRGERIAPFETVRCHKDGTAIAVSLTISLLTSATGQIIGAVDVARDITARRAAEAAVQLLNATLETRIQERTAQLEEAVKELEAFSYSVSHDLRAPLRAINGFSRILHTDYAAALPAEAQGYLMRVQANAEHMSALIDDLLTFSRLNRQPVRRLALDPTTLAQQALDELAQADEPRVAAVTIEPLHPCTGDPILLRQVFMNLLANALKFTAHQPVPQITVGCQASAQAAAPVYFVADNGVGFDMRYADKLFGVFHRLHRMEDYPGTGVGLALVQRIIHRHGGRIWADAAPNHGATFCFTIGEDRDADARD